MLVHPDITQHQARQVYLCECIPVCHEATCGEYVLCIKIFQCKMSSQLCTTLCVHRVNLTLALSASTQQRLEG